MKQYTFRMALSRDQIMRMYQGHAKRLRVRTEQGLVIELGLEKIRPFVTLNGVQGYFRLSAEESRFIGIERIG